MRGAGQDFGIGKCGSQNLSQPHQNYKESDRTTIIQNHPKFS